MNRERVFKVLLSPCISEKSTLIADKYNQFVFKVVSSSTKLEIKKAVEYIFKVNVLKVAVQNIQGKTKRTMRGYGKRKNWKKAIVTLREGQEIDYSNNVVGDGE